MKNTFFLYNSEFGKSIQSERNRRDVRTLTNEKMRSKQCTSLIYFQEINLVSDFL